MFFSFFLKFVQNISLNDFYFGLDFIILKFLLSNVFEINFEVP